MKTNAFKNPIFNTDYSFQSPRSLIRIMSDAFSRQHCDYEEAKRYASYKTKGKCLYCGVPLYNVKKYTETGIVEYSNNLHYDHIYPAIQLNLFDIGNVVLSCESCNLDKSSSLPLDYYDKRAAQNLSLYTYDRENFEKFLSEYIEPYKTKWPDHYEIHKLELSDDEFREKMIWLLNDIDISSATTRYNHQSSVNIDVWNNVVERAYQEYAELTAKDIEHRIGYTNEMFEDMFGIAKRIEDCSVAELGRFTNQLLSSKYESKNEIQKFRRLIKTLVDILNEEIMEGQLEGFYNKVPTYSKIKEIKEE